MGKKLALAGVSLMFLSDFRGQQTSRNFTGVSADVEHASDPLQAERDEQLIADCRLLTRQLGSLLSEIEQASEVEGGDQGREQAALCEADDQVLDLIERIAVTRAVTDCGVQSKHTVAVLLITTGWRDEPAPYRDALLLSFVRDAARLHYPAAQDDEASEDATTQSIVTVINQSKICLSIFEELAVRFTKKDRDDALLLAEQEHDLDASILALREQETTAIVALLGMQATSASALNAKRLVLRRMLETGDSDADQLRVELIRSYLGDLDAFDQAKAQGQKLAPGYSSLWNTISSRLRRLTSTAHQG